MVPSQRVRAPAEAIVKTHAFYGFTDWDHAVYDTYNAYEQEAYNQDERREAARLASTMSSKLKQSYDAITKEVLGG